MLCLLSFFVAYHFYGSLQHPTSLSEPLYLHVALISILLPFSLFLSGSYDFISRFSGAKTIPTFLKGMTLFIFFLIVCHLASMRIGEGLILSIQVLILSVSIFFSRYIFWVFGRLLNITSERVLIYGAGHAGRRLAAIISNGGKRKVYGFIDDSSEIIGVNINGVKVFASDQLDHLIKKFQIKTILLAIPSVKKDRRSEIISSLKGRGVGIKTIPNLDEILSNNSALGDIRDLKLDELLGRESFNMNSEEIIDFLKNQVVLITGAGGSIGSEISRQILRGLPASIILVDSSEWNLYQIQRLILEEVKSNFKLSSILIIPILATVTDPRQLDQVFEKYRPTIVFHVAAYKHVPLVEANPLAAILTNIIGTYNCINSSTKYCAHRFVLVSTDKAVRPSSVMGATKRFAELLVQAHAADSILSAQVNFSIVRFGNVIGSSGSVIPLFLDQIRKGGPITITDVNMTRYFMTIPEAAQLVIKAGSLSSGGELYILEMGDPLYIRDLACKLVAMLGLTIKDEFHPHGDIEIHGVGIREGEKLFEELLIGAENSKLIHEKIIVASEAYIPWDALSLIFYDLRDKAINLRADEALAILWNAIDLNHHDLKLK